MEYSYIGIGSNQGDSLHIIKKAVELIDMVQGIRVVRVAPLFRTQPVGYLEQPWFYNTVAEIETDIKPLALLKVLHNTENQLGRVRTIRWGPRTIDLDILLYADITVEHPELVVPHPRMTERAFVMVPLAHLIPDRVIADKTVAQIADYLQRVQKIKMCKK